MFNYLIDDSGALAGPVEFPVVPGIGVQLPSNAITLGIELSKAPVAHTWAFVEDALQLKADCRGDVYRTDTGFRETWVELGDLPQGYTTQVWPGTYYRWVNEAWALDEKAHLADLEHQALTKRDTLLRDAVVRIAPLQYAEDIGDASHDEQLALMEWKLYSVELNRIERQTDFPTEVVWPPVPGTVAA
ncbi:phage tail protein [Pseudomonas frederiksbergensis]|uniref:Phage tail protein n=1 Tax=Pseudomonas frederiksbergensis TaxID=104087 RepID=A0A423K0B9_9PSED|nr:tail fiber assembly protein [Pseudomonas frederiksbergensis]RON43944.1 phage tail protein [Pseudomonas frederiksbergensis]